MRRRLISSLIIASLLLTILVGCNKAEEVGREPISKNEKVSVVDGLPVKTVFVSPEWVKSVIDGKQEESKDFKILEVS